MSENRTVRMISELQIWVHKHLIHFTALFLLTGVILVSKDSFGWMAEILGYPISKAFAPGYDAYSAGVQVARWLHRLSALGLASVLIPYAIAEIFRAKNWDIWPECWSLSCFSNGVRELIDYYLHKKHVPFGKYNMGQKLWTWAVVIGMIWMYLTGIVMWYRDSFSVAAWRYAHLLHTIGFYLAVIGLALHVYLAVLIPEHKPMVTAMFRTGTVPEEFAQSHHPKWYEKIKSKQ